MTSITLRAPNNLDAEIFLEVMRQSCSLHSNFVRAPQNHAEYLAYIAKSEQGNDKYFIAWDNNNNIIGVFNISGIAQEGAFKSAYLGVYANSKFAGQGLMSQALKLVLQEIFYTIKLHRIEANIQPNNYPSILLFSNNGFKLEGYSPRYLYIEDAWRDHMRFALTYEDWLKLSEKRPELLITREQACAIDKRCLEDYMISLLILMENAGRGIVEYFLRFKPQGPIIICCGSGNNGGDGFVVGRHLHNKGYNVEILLFAELDKLKTDAKTNYDIAMLSGIPIKTISNNNMHNLASYLEKSQWVIDALFGSGLQGIVSAPYDKIINTINAAAKSVLAIDIPSGIDCNSGDILGTAIVATHTATMVAKKLGFTNPKARKYLGLISIIDIGAPKACFSAEI